MQLLEATLLTQDTTAEQEAVEGQEKAAAAAGQEEEEEEEEEKAEEEVEGMSAVEPYQKRQKQSHSSGSDATVVPSCDAATTEQRLQDMAEMFERHATHDAKNMVRLCFLAVHVSSLRGS